MIKFTIIFLLSIVLLIGIICLIVSTTYKIRCISKYLETKGNEMDLLKYTSPF